jgi:hypothetical protein
MAEPTTRVGKIVAHIRFPYLRRRRMKRALGPHLAATTRWRPPSARAAVQTLNHQR